MGEHEYDCYRISLRLKSGVGTPWQADTVTGNLAWLEAVREEGEDLKKYLDLFAAGAPPFVLSDGFPENLLPRPISQWESAQSDDLTSYAKNKLRRKAEFVKTEDFDSIRRAIAVDPEPAPLPWVEVETLHASISRSTGTTGGEVGNLFSIESFVLRHPPGETENSILNIYALCKEGWKSRLEGRLKDLSMVGFGRDKSIGLGQFEFIKMEPWEKFSYFEGADGFIALSSFVPAEEDPVEGKWVVSAKYGRLGENAGAGNPFKRPFLQIKPGAVFYSGKKPKPFYGRVLKDLAPGFPEAIQICYCLAVPTIFPSS